MTTAAAERIATTENMKSHRSLLARVTHGFSTNTLLVAITAEGKYLENEYNRYLTTNDKSIIERLDTRKTGVYLKYVDALENIMKPDDGPDKDGKLKQPLVNINMAMGAKATVQQTDAKTLEITDETAGELVKALAGMKKSIEKK